MARVVHFEIPVDDPDRARAFYTDVFAWEIAGWGGESYWLAATGGEGDMGIDGALISRGDIHGSPVIVIGVGSIDDTLTKAESAGAEVLAGKQVIPTIGYSAYLRDPEGNVIGIFEPDDSAA